MGKEVVLVNEAPGFITTRVNALDVRLGILEYLHTTLGEKYRPNELLRQYVKLGRLARKTGRGVYEYPQQKAAEKEG